MCKLGKLIFLAVGLGTSSLASADWEYASNTGQSETGDFRYTRCYYKTMMGFEFAIVIQRFCPISIEFDPETQQWRQN